ncbi:hypothetical protein [Neobacillus sp. LXY-1]|uniref:hypothetical protein n=1 Tax=Neobacillus sp. LXY-1 TaxID=3379133 RepID=UPI003EDF195A
MANNLLNTNAVVSGQVYMVELADGDLHSFRVLTETPTHFIFSYSTEGSNDVFEKSKSDIYGIYDVKEWLAAQEK